MPEVRKKLPDVKLIIAGNNPPQEIQDYASDTTIVTGYVEDLAPYLKKARISVSPLRYGAGMKGKIGEALSWSLPVVTTSVGAEGIKLVDGEQALIADEAAAFAEKIIMLYQDAQLWKKLSVKGRRHVNANWSPQVIKKTLSSVFGKPEIASVKKAEELVSIIMLTFNALEYTKKCIRSIQKQTKYPHEIIIVDNGSKDGTRKYLRELEKNFKNIHIKLNKKNKGFSGGNNIGAKLAKGKYVCFLNNDVLVSDGWLESMVNALEADEKIGMVGPLTNSISGLQMVTNISYKDEAGFYKYAAVVRAQYAGKITPRRRIAGFAFIMRKKIYTQLGGFDESFGIGNYEDDDLCLRVRQKGYAIMVDEGTFIHHFGSQTFKANGIDIGQSLDEKGKVFKEKWPDVDYEELLEMKNPLSKLHVQRIKVAAEKIKNGFVEEASEIFLSVLAEHPLHSEALLGMATCLIQLKDYNRVGIYINKLLREEPNNAHALNLAGLAFAGKGDIEAAKSSFSRAIEKNPQFVDAQRNLGDLFIEAGEYETGIKIFQTLLKNHPSDIPSLLYMGELNLEAGRPEDALIYVKRILQLDAENELAKRLKTIIETNFAQSHEFASKKMTATALQEENTKELLKTYREILEQQPESAEALLGAARCCNLLSKHKQASVYINKLLRVEPENAQAYNQSGLALAGMKEYASAKSVFELAIQKDPRCIDAQRNYGDTLIELGDFENGVRVFQEILKRNPKDVASLLYMTDLNFEAQRYEDARIYCNQALKTEPQNELALQYKALLDNPPKDSDAQNTGQTIEQANSFLEEGKTNEAITLYQTVLNAAPDNLNALFGMATACQIKEEFAQSRKWLQKALEYHRDIPEIYNMLGNLELIEENTDQAIAYFSASLEINSAQAEIRNRLADALLMDKQYEQGIQLLLKTQKEFPEDSGTLLHLGSVYLEAGREEEAESLFRKVLDLDPENKPVLEYFENRV